MKTQEWLRNNGGNLELLEQQLGISSTVHEDGRVILNYSMIDSPKQNDIVRECRGLVLDSKNDWAIVARAFPRFFNVGEFPDEFKNFNWNNCKGYHKEDGSLLLVYYWHGAWRFNTRGSFGQGEINYSGITWEDLARQAMPKQLFYQGYHHCTYVFELCSPHNKIVRTYPEPKVFLLAIYDIKKNEEWDFEDVEWEAEKIGVEMPYVSQFFHIEDVESYIILMAQEDPTFEGIVLRDIMNRRWKVKSPEYLALHRMANNGDPCHPKNILPFIISGEVDELLSYFPETRQYVADMEAAIMIAKSEVDNLWHCYHDEPSQKKFALAVKDSVHSSILFSARKLGLQPLDLMDLEYFVKFFTKREK
jgi:hypothetical protein